jgi:hypothetical protein
MRLQQALRPIGELDNSGEEDEEQEIDYGRVRGAWQRRSSGRQVAEDEAGGRTSLREAPFTRPPNSECLLAGESQVVSCLGCGYSHGSPTIGSQGNSMPAASGCLRQGHGSGDPAGGAMGPINDREVVCSHEECNILFETEHGALSHRDAVGCCSVGGRRELRPVA